MNTKRLLALAALLDTADAEHRRKGEPTYQQGQYHHECGTPACALGHWAAKHPRRWAFDASIGQPILRDSGLSGFAAGAEEFDLIGTQSAELFGFCGCGGARTGKQAAAYIRKFVRREMKAEKGQRR